MGILVVGQTVYFLTLAGENLFNMERSYKAVCHRKLEDIAQADIINGMEDFKFAAAAGRNPRKFISFNANRLTALKKKSVRVAMARQFSIPLDADGDKFDASVEGTAEKIVKLLCNKGMIDPFEKMAVEVVAPVNGSDWAENTVSVITDFCMFFPLWISVLFIDIKSILEGNPNIWPEIISVSLILLVSIISLVVLMHELNPRNTSNQQEYRIVSAKEEKTITAEYLL